MKYICSCSGGKDSVATIILAHEKKEPLDIVLFSEVMFDENTSGENLEHIEFIYNVLKPTCEKWGYKFVIVRDKLTYLDCFNHIVLRSKTKERNGQKSGFPMAGKCAINKLKVAPIKKYIKNIDDEVLQYIGIASDEPIRLQRLTSDRISLLDKYNYTEAQARALCEKYGLLSPVYKYSTRGGCWFCPNAKPDELRALYKNHNQLFNKLCELEKQKNLVGYCWNMLKKQYINDYKILFEDEEKQYNIFDYIDREIDKP